MSGSEGEILRRAYRVTGRVQGVGYRWWAIQEASRLGLAGTIRNAADGSVEVEAVGPELDLEAFEARLREGPPHAVVRAVERRPPGAEPLPTTFELRR